MLLLTGCSAADNLIENAVGEAVEQGVESATGAEVESGEDGFSVTTEDGEFSIGSDGTLPEGFPEAEVPVVEGDIIQTAKVADGTADGYLVTVSVEGALDDVHADALGRLEGAGFTVAADVDLEEMRSTSLEGAGDVEAVTLGVIANSGDGTCTVSYTVAMAGAQ